MLKTIKKIASDSLAFSPSPTYIADNQSTTYSPAPRLFKFEIATHFGRKENTRSCNNHSM